MTTDPEEFTMTIEGTPEIQFDWQAEYAKQRRSRLADSIAEYLDDGDVSILEFYNDLKDEIEQIITYHKTYKEKAEGALQLILGHRPVDGLEVDEKLSEKWQLNIPTRY